MHIRSSVLLSAVLLLGSGSLAQAQTKATAAKKPAAKETKAVKDSLEAQSVRQNFKQVLDAVNDAWFGKAYQGVTSVELQGTMAITLNAAAMNNKIDQLGEGAIKGNITKNGNVNLRVKSVYFANTDFRSELTGEFGNILYYRAANRGFIYSKEQNAYTTRVDPTPSDAPTSFLGWFRQCINDIQTVYVDGPTFKASWGKEVSSGGNSLATLTFVAPTSPYDPKKREQSVAESLGFWKRGKLEVVFDKTTRLPQSMNYSNEGQGIFTRMTLNYNPGGKLNSVTIANQSRGMEGPASLQIGYGGDGLMNHVAGEMGFSQGRMRFDMDLTWSKTRKIDSIKSIPPPSATKKGREEMETLLLVNLAGKVMDLQKAGFNLRSVSLTNK